MNYLSLLEESYADLQNTSECTPESALEFLGEHIFGFITYEYDCIKSMALMALDVCIAIDSRTTFEYIESNHFNYLLMVNMPFFKDKLEWGGSIRGAWWDLHGDKEFTIESCGLWYNNEQILSLRFNKEQWSEFIIAMQLFAANDL